MMSWCRSDRWCTWGKNNRTKKKCCKRRSISCTSNAETGHLAWNTGTVLQKFRQNFPESKQSFEECLYNVLYVCGHGLKANQKSWSLRFEVWGWRFWQMSHVTFHVKENSMMHPLVSNCIKWVTSNVWGIPTKFQVERPFLSSMPAHMSPWIWKFVRFIWYHRRFKKPSKNSRSFGSFGSFCSRKWINYRTFHCQCLDLVAVTNWGVTCYSNILGFSFVWWGFWPRNSCSRPWPWRTEWRAWERLNFNGFPIAMLSFEWELLFAENQVDLLQRL